jgi:hypothetical protein
LAFRTDLVVRAAVPVQEMDAYQTPAVFEEAVGFERMDKMIRISMLNSFPLIKINFHIVSYAKRTYGGTESWYNVDILGGRFLCQNSQITNSSHFFEKQ